MDGDDLAGGPPKDDSYRSPNWEPCVPVDLPAFLDHLLASHAKAQPGRRCACAALHDGSGQYLFLGPDGGHHRRSNYARRVFRPACDGGTKLRRAALPGSSSPT